MEKFLLKHGVYAYCFGVLFTHFIYIFGFNSKIFILEKVKFVKKNLMDVSLITLFFIFFTLLINHYLKII